MIGKLLSLALLATLTAFGQTDLHSIKAETAPAESPAKSSGMVKEVAFGLFLAAPNQTEADRFYLRYHGPEVVRGSGPWLRRYESYLPHDPPVEAAERFGATRGRYAELWFSSLEEFQSRPQHLPFSIPSWDPPGSKIPRGAKFIAVVPALPTEEFYDPDPNPEQTTILRWVTIMKYPEGVSLEDGEKWFLGVYAKEALKQPGLLKFVSYRCLKDAGAPKGMMPGDVGAKDESAKAIPAPKSAGWVRVNEYWYKDFAAWRKAVIDSPPSYTPPPWGGSYPFVTMGSTFIDYYPDVDFLKGGYTIP